jgi:hypothetical protein
MNNHNVKHILWSNWTEKTVHDMEDNMVDLDVEDRNIDDFGDGNDLDLDDDDDNDAAIADLENFLSKSLK